MVISSHLTIILFINYQLIFKSFKYYFLVIDKNNSMVILIQDKIINFEIILYIYIVVMIYIYTGKDDYCY